MIKIFEIIPHTLLFLTQEGLDISFLISINKVPTNRLFRSVGTFIRDFFDKSVTPLSGLIICLRCRYYDLTDRRGRRSLQGEFCILIRSPLWLWKIKNRSRWGFCSANSNCRGTYRRGSSLLSSRGAHGIWSRLHSILRYRRDGVLL